MNQLSQKGSGRWKEVLFHGYFLCMFMMAFHFFKERLYADSAYYIFNTIDSGFFVTPHQRIVLAFSEIVPLIFFYLGASLKTLLISWSLCHVLFYYTIFLIALYKLKSEAGALAVILLNVIGQSWLYFSPMLEICYGAALLVIFKILLDENKFTRWRWFWLIFLEIFILTSHPENFVIFFFVVGYDVLKNGFRKSPHLWLTCIFIATIIFKTQTFSEYEGGKIHFMTDTSQNHLYEDLLNKDYLRDLWKLFKENYVDLIVLLSVTFIYLVLQKKYFRFLFLFAVLAGLLVLVNATNFARDYSRYNESLYYPLVAIAVVAFAFEVYETASVNWKLILLAGCCFVAVSRISEIHAVGKYLSFRIDQLDELVQQAHDRKKGKCVVNKLNAETERWFLNWSYPIESMMLSALKGPDSTVSIVPDEEYIYRDTSVQLTSERVMVRRWEIRDNKNALPFFKFRNENYFALNTNDSAIDAGYFSGKIALDFSGGKTVFQYDRFFFSVTMTNTSGRMLSSLPIETCYLETTCEKEGATTKSVIPLDVDLSAAYKQALSCPIKNGRGEISVTVKLVWKGTELAAATHQFQQ